MSEKLSDYSYAIKKENERKITNLILFFIILFIFINILISFVVFPVKQISSSMTPDLPDNSLIMVSPIVKNINRGDVVLINPNNLINEKQSFIKKFGNMCVRFFTAQQYDPSIKNTLPGSKNKLRRIVGMPGDTIYMRDYVLYIKPEGQKHFLTEFEISDKSYNVTFYVAPGEWDSSIGVKGSFDEITLGKDEYFLLGDNRKSCDDSRLWGSLSFNDFKAKALFCYFPFSNLKLY